MHSTYPPLLKEAVIAILSSWIGEPWNFKAATKMLCQIATAIDLFYPQASDSVYDIQWLMEGPNLAGVRVGSVDYCFETSGFRINENN